MPMQLTMYSIPEAAGMLGMAKGYLSTYCSEREIGTKKGRDRWLTEAEIEKIRNRKMGRPKKNSQIGA